MSRPDGRRPDELRPVTITRNFIRHAEGSALIQVGETRVVCTASAEDRVPPFLRDTGQGWVTAEYGMLPRSTATRTPRESATGRSGRSTEIQRLIGRSLRAVTDLPGILLTIRTADCAALGLYDPVHRAIGVAHVGWRGLAVGVTQRVADVMAQHWGTRPADLRVAIGPMIGPCCYEVGPEFAPRFPAWVRQAGGRSPLDLRAGIYAQLAAAGVAPARICDSGVCTACQAERFYSYRREGAAAGRCHFALALTVT